MERIINYVYLKNDRVMEVIPDYVDVFPGVPITQRYSEEFLSSCVEVPVSVEVHPRDIYDSDTNAFSRPPEPEPVESTPVEELTPKEQRELAYKTRQSIEWEGSTLTIDEANMLYLAYLAEENTTLVNELSALIKTAKDEIRLEFPDKEE